MGELTDESVQDIRQVDGLPMPDAVMIWRSGADMGCTYFSESWLAFAGRALEHEVGHGWAERVHPEDVSHCLDIYRSAFMARQEFQMQYRLRRYDGRCRRMLDIGTPEWDADGQFLGYVGSCVDVTGRTPSGDWSGGCTGRHICVARATRCRCSNASSPTATRAKNGLVGQTSSDQADCADSWCDRLVGYPEWKYASRKSLNHRR